MEVLSAIFFKLKKLYLSMHCYRSFPQLVEPMGFEPTTPCMRYRCATNCAMAPLFTNTGGQNEIRTHDTA